MIDIQTSIFVEKWLEIINLWMILSFHMCKAIRVTREVDLILILIEDLDQFGTSVQVKISDFQLNDEGLVVQFNEIIRSNKTQLKI